MITSLLFFFYSREHKGALGVASQIGIFFLMVSFGAGYGYTVMSRVSLLIGRFQFLLEDWLGMALTRRRAGVPARHSTAAVIYPP